VGDNYREVSVSQSSRTVPLQASHLEDYAYCQSSCVIPFITQPSEQDGIQVSQPNSSTSDTAIPCHPSDLDKDTTSPAIHPLPSAGVSSSQVRPASSYSKPWQSPREKFRQVMLRLKAKFDDKINRSNQPSEEEAFGDFGYSSSSGEDQNERAQLDIMRCLPMSAFIALLLRSLPKERQMLRARTLGVSCGTYHYVFLLDAMD
jgi:hypothetical protein